MKSKIITFVKLLNEYLYYISFNRLVIYIIYPTCIITASTYMIYTKITFEYEFCMMISSFINLLMKELFLFYLINIILFIFDHPFNVLRQRNHKHEINKVLTKFKREFNDEKEIILLREKEIIRIKTLIECRNKYEIEISKMKESNEKEKNDLKQELNKVLTKFKRELNDKTNEILLHKKRKK